MMGSLPCSRTGGEDHVARRASSPLTRDVQLRDIREADLPIFFEHQLDPEATRMAAFPSRDRDAFMAHWARIMSHETNPTGILNTILADDTVAGNVVYWEAAGEPNIAYWLGK